MKMVRLFLLSTIVMTFVVESDLRAQTRGGGSTGPSTGIGSGNLTATQSGNTQSFGGGGTGGGGGGQATGGQGTQFGQQQSQFNMGDGTLGQQVGQDTFVGQGNQGFVGNRMTGQTGGQAITPNFAGFQNTANANRNTTNQSTSRAPLIRPRLRIDFAVPQIPTPEIQAATVDRLANVPRAKGVQLAMDNSGTVTLSGNVANENDRRVLEAFVRMEPGVRDVDNQLVVTP